MNTFTAILKGKCPRCREGNLFTHHPYNIKKAYSMHKNCPVCGQSTCPEPLFYDGSMYVSYGFSVAIVVSTFVAFNVLFEDPNLNWMIAIAIGTAVLFGPLNLRLSRTIWIYFFVKYDKNAASKFRSAQKTPETTS